MVKPRLPGARPARAESPPGARRRAILLAAMLAVLSASPRTREFALLGTRSVAAESLSAEEREERLAHAHELLGKYYKTSVVRSGEQVKKINGLIFRRTRRLLPEKYKSGYRKIAGEIIGEAHRYEFDPVFIISVIITESGFVPTRKGGVGELGLMQLRPGTAKWVAQRFHIKWRGKKALTDPVYNIRIGSAYLSYLREELDSHARLYLAAYNMGLYNVKDAVDRNVWPKDYPLRVMKQYVAFYDSLERKQHLSGVTPPEDGKLLEDALEEAKKALDEADLDDVLNE